MLPMVRLTDRHERQRNRGARQDDGCTLAFCVKVYDEMEPSGDGTHERVAVNVERFSARVGRKIKGA
jgi:predicted thioesterase